MVRALVAPNDADQAIRVGGEGAAVGSEKMVIAWVILRGFNVAGGG